MKLLNIGDTVTAVKHGVTMVGTVTDWRSKYGGTVQYTVELQKPVQYRWCSTPTYTVLIKDSEVVQ